MAKTRAKWADDVPGKQHPIPLMAFTIRGKAVAAFPHLFDFPLQAQFFSTRCNCRRLQRSCKVALSIPISSAGASPFSKYCSTRCSTVVPVTLWVEKRSSFSP